MNEPKPTDEMINNIPQPVKDSRYDRIMRRLWEMEQRLVFMEKATVDYVGYDAFLQLRDRVDKMEGINPEEECP